MPEPRESRALDVAMRLTMLAMPVVLAITGWLISSVSAHESRVSVLEETRKVLLEQVLGDLAEIKASVQRIEDRLRTLEMRP